MSPLASYLTPHWEGLILEEEVASGGLQELGAGMRKEGSQILSLPWGLHPLGLQLPLRGVVPPEKNLQAKN